jgi:hypothetical protein
LNSKEFFFKKAVCGLGHAPSQTAFLLSDLFIDFFLPFHPSFSTSRCTSRITSFYRFDIARTVNNVFNFPNRGPDAIA